MSSALRLLFLASLGLSLTALDALAAPNCSSFVYQSDLLGVTTVASTFFEADASVRISNAFNSINTSLLPAFCRVQIKIVTNSTANSSANTEVWLPQDWNGRFVGLGNGGFGGGARVADLGWVAVMQGFAGVSTDTGHSSSSDDGSWAGPGNDNAIIDWSYRALHLSVLAAKELVTSYYGDAPTNSYYVGCSNGGRQGIAEIQMFPEDFDGAVIGSPANDWTRLQAWGVHMSTLVQPVGSPQWIPEAMWTGLIHNEVLNQCDGLDGLVDKMVSYAADCQFRPETLACRIGQDPSTCLSPTQIETIHKIYSDYVDTNQTYVFGPYFPGGDADWSKGLLGEVPLGIAIDYFKYFILNDTTWDMYTMDLDTIQLGNEINPGSVNVISPNLTAFLGSPHNGKVLHYVGWADQLISPRHSIEYYDSVYAFMQSETEMEIDDVYRFYTVPGMQHCMGGYGPNAFGGAEQAANGMPPPSQDPEYNMLWAMIRWVENGTAPESFTGTYWNNNSYTNGVGFTRPLCKYPTRLRYVSGDPNNATSFTCV